MFTWSDEYSMEIRAPLDVVWKLCTTPSDWPKWTDEYEWCQLEGEFKPGAKIIVKMKKPVKLSVFITEAVPKRSYKIFSNPSFCKQEGSSELEAISADCTRVTARFCYVSLFAPILKFFLKKHLLEINSRIMKSFVEHAERCVPPPFPQ